MRRTRSRCMLVIILIVATVILINCINLLANHVSNEEVHIDVDSQVARSAVKSDLKRLLRRFEKLLSYLESNHEQVNLDGLFGIRMAQSKSSASLTVARSWANIRSPSFQAAIGRSSGSKTLKALQKRVESLAELVVKSAKESTPEYFEMFKNLIDQPFLSSRVHLVKPQVDESLMRAFGSYGNSEFDEPFSDRCYSMLLGKSRTECAFSKDCFRFFSEPNASGKNFCFPNERF